MLLFAKTLEEVVHMLEGLSKVLLEYGLELNQLKTKILCNETVGGESTYCITNCGAIEFLGSSQKLKYFGRMFCGDVNARGVVAVNHRISCAWMKYRNFQHIFEDKHIPFGLRLRLFEAVVTPTVLYSLETCPMTQKLQNQLDVVQRTMVRKLIGWVCSTEHSWEMRGHKMKERMNYYLSRHPMRVWSDMLFKRKQKCLNYVSSLPYWTRVVLEWDPTNCESANYCVALRNRGHPFRRWYNEI